MHRKIILKGECCRLARLEMPDLSLIKTWRNEQREVLRQNKILTDQDQKKWFKFLAKDKNQRVFSIVNDWGELLGYCGLTHIDWDNRRAELSFLLKTGVSKVFYKKIFMDVLGLLQKYCVALHLHRLFAETFEFRKFHISVLEEFGFKREGVLTDHVYKKGRFYDSLLHYILL